MHESRSSRYEVVTETVQEEVLPNGSSTELGRTRTTRTTVVTETPVGTRRTTKGRVAKAVVAGAAMGVAKGLLH